MEMCVLFLYYVLGQSDVANNVDSKGMYLSLDAGHAGVGRTESRRGHSS